MRFERWILSVILCIAASANVFAQSQNDHVIVPGQRIGPVSLGMSAQDLYRAMGEPQSSVTGNDGTWARYTWPDLVADIDLPQGRVSRISTTSAQYATADGIKVGMSQLGLSATRPSPTGITRTEPGNAVYCYSDHLSASTQTSSDNESVSFISVWSDGAGWAPMCASRPGNWICYERDGMTYKLGVPCRREDEDER